MSSDANPKLPTGIDLAAVRAKLAQEGGNRYWQSLEELSETETYNNFLVNEFAEPDKPGSKSAAATY